MCSLFRNIARAFSQDVAAVRLFPLHVRVPVVVFIVCRRLNSKQPKPVVSGWVVSGYHTFPHGKNCGNADKQQCKHVFKREGRNSDPN